jgi:hypothetical protein
MTFYVKIGTDSYSGRVMDISVVGMACVFDRKIDMPVGTQLTEMHVNLHQTVLRINGTISVVRGDSPAVHVVMFDPDLPDMTREKILAYVHANLQRFIEKKTASLPES